MFKKILIANRGEIACRIMRTASRMGIRTVAVCSDADRAALHAGMADELIEIGGTAPGESYLSVEKIIAACRASGAEAVHPGYGFLSENADFVRALDEAGIAFIGPPAAAIAAMGDKLESKRRAKAAGVSTVPGHPDPIADAAEAKEVAAEIGYPVMLKASAGGGGKGMRIARGPADVADGFARARSEAKSAFGDDRILIEKFIETPRHIEIQVLADRHGKIVHLGERECSIQRRNQKVVEEAPSPFLDPATRSAMGAEAVALARAVDYASAGTVEFIVDRDRNFYFLEMNTRLQVEHPVTELVTGLDLVEEMIRISSGEPLRISQDDVRMDGWAIEARVYAEDPFRGFLPSTGRLTRYRPPAESAAIRNDSGVTEGSEISIHYDPMIAKLCAHAPTRDAATDLMADALDAFVIDGVRHNIPFLSALMAHPRWREGRLSTAFIDEEFPEGFQGVEAGPDDIILAVIGAVCRAADRRRHKKSAEAQNTDVGIAVLVDSARRDLTVTAPEAEIFSVAAAGDGRSLRVETVWRPGDPVWGGLIDGRPVTAQVRRERSGFRIGRRGRSARVQVLPAPVADLLALMPADVVRDTSDRLLCPMPGLVLSISVAVGQRVAPGEALATVEAMKMENVLTAEREAVVSRIVAQVGQSIAVDDVILEFEKAGGDA
jgi:propionyl-CoA carboxylase alpha chain